MPTIRPEEISAEALQCWVDQQEAANEDFACSFVRFVTGLSHTPPFTSGISEEEVADMEHEILGQEREIKDLHEEIGKAQKALDKAETSAADLQETIEALNAEAARLRQERDAALSGTVEGNAILQEIVEAEAARDRILRKAPAWAQSVRHIEEALAPKGARKDKSLWWLKKLAADIEAEIARRK